MPESLARATTLAEQLLAWIEEDETLALAPGSGRWHAEHMDGVGGFMLCDERGPFGRAPYPQYANHIARHDPARVLAECAVKRRIVETHTPTDQHELCPVCVDWDAEIQEDYYVPNSEQFPCLTLRTLAQPYADHPEFRDEWRA